MKITNKKQALVTGVTFVVGVFLSALCYNMLFLPNNFVVSGMSGIAIALEGLFNINATVFIYASSAILLIVSFIFLGKDKTRNTIIGSLLYPLMITFTVPIAAFLNETFPLDDMLLILIFSVILNGVSSGLVYKYGYTTGGMDVIMQLLNKYLKIPESKANITANVVVIVFGGITFGYVKAIYSLIILILSSFFVDKIMFGVANSKLFYIFTKKEKEVEKVILDELGSGFTLLPTKGGYSHTKGNLLLCVVPNRDYYLFKERILAIDPNAFFVIESCYEVNGGVVKHSSLPFF